MKTLLFYTVLAGSADRPKEQNNDNFPRSRIFESGLSTTLEFTPKHLAPVPKYVFCPPWQLYEYNTSQRSCEQSMRMKSFSFFTVFEVIGLTTKIGKMKKFLRCRIFESGQCVCLEVTSKHLRPRHKHLLCPSWQSYDHKTCQRSCE